VPDSKAPRKVRFKQGALTVANEAKDPVTDIGDAIGQIGVTIAQYLAGLTTINDKRAAFTQNLYA
jgi:hypothetical protein